MIKIFKLFIVFQMFLILSCQNKTSNTSSNNVTENDSLRNRTIITEGEPNETPDIDNEILTELEYRSPAIVYKNDNILYVYADMHQGFRMFGYAEPDTTSQKMIFYSIFTNDVENNPFKCPFGAYYETNGFLNGKILILPKDDSEFVKAEIHNIEVANDTISNVVYFLKDYIYFE